MRGGFLHNHVLVQRLAQAFRTAGAGVLLEQPVRTGRNGGYVDLLASWPERLIAVEAECRPDRVPHDLVKARDLQADHLWLVAPNVPAKAALRRCLARLAPVSSFLVLCLTLGEALARIPTLGLGDVFAPPDLAATRPNSLNLQPAGLPGRQTPNKS